MFDAALSQS
jgi:uncharacterized protein